MDIQGICATPFRGQFQTDQKVEIPAVPKSSVPRSKEIRIRKDQGIRARVQLLGASRHRSNDGVDDVRLGLR